MIGGPPEQSRERAANHAWIQSAVLFAASLLVVAVFAASANPTISDLNGSQTSDATYNLLVEAFQSGQVSLKKAVPSGLAQLADPYDPVANYPYRMPPTLADDLTYYRGKFYVYFGASPALVLLWPWAALTGRYLAQRLAVLIFCTAGFLVSVGLLREIRRRAFPNTGAGAAAAGVIALGLATSAPILLQRADVWEVPVACSYALSMLALAAVWRALQDPGRRGRWLAAASFAYGLAIGARPAVLFGALILLPPVVAAGAEKRCRRVPAPEERPPAPFRLFLCAMSPLAICGLGIMAYNFRRFGNPLEFGQHFQLASDRQAAVRHFSPEYLWFNFRVTFLEPVRWTGGFPFVSGIAMPPVPIGHQSPEDPFGVLTNIPFVWLSLAAPLALRNRSTESKIRLKAFLASAALLFTVTSLTLCLYYANCSRYEMEFLPALILLAVIGVLALEREFANRPARRGIVRMGWGLLLVFSVAFNLLAGLSRFADQRYNIGNALFLSGKTSEAAGQFESALRVRPDFADAQNNLGNALMRMGRPQEALDHYEAAARDEPDLPEAHYNLGNILARAGRPIDAVAQYEQALHLKPSYAQAHYNLSVVLSQLGRMAEAEAHYREALRLRPDMARGP
jgi:hypothetical protein